MGDLAACGLLLSPPSAARFERRRVGQDGRCVVIIPADGLSVRRDHKRMFMIGRSLDLERGSRQRRPRSSGVRASPCCGHCRRLR